MNNIMKIARMEFKMTAANKAFIIITILGPFVILAFTFLPTLFAMNSIGIDEGTTIAVVGGDDELWALIDSTSAGSPFTLVRDDDVQTLRSRILDGELNGYLEVPKDYLNAESMSYFSRSGSDFVISQSVKGYIGGIIVAVRMNREGLDAGRISYLSRRPDVDVFKVAEGGDSEGEDEATVLITAIAFVMLLYMSVLLYGQATGRSVLKEKLSKTVEIMLSSVRPIDMLFGKLLGQVLAAIVQYGIWISVGLALISFVGPTAGISLPAALSPETFGFLALFFLLAFFMYSAAFAAVGSGAEDESHLGQLAAPFIIFLILPMMLSSAIIINPNSTISIVLSYFPFTAPIVMFVRTLIDTPAFWEIGLCVVVMLISITIMIALAAKIFKIGLLMTGKRFNLKDIARWVRY